MALGILGSAFAPKWRNVFFSFHYDADVMCAAQIRQAGEFLDEHIGVVDWADWEATRRSDEQTIRRWIDRQLEGASVTVVLIGAETATRKWVMYEIHRSLAEGKGLLGIYVNRMNAIRHPPSVVKGPNPFTPFPPKPAAASAAGLLGGSPPPSLSTIFGRGLTIPTQPSSLAFRVPCYCWIADNGPQNIGRWVNEAAQAVGR